MLISLSRAFEISESRNEDVVNFISECILLVLGLGNDSNTFLGQVLPTLRRVVTRHRVLNNTTLHRALIAISSFIVQDGGVTHIHSLAEICNHTGHSFLDMVVPPLVVSFSSNTTSATKTSWCVNRTSLLGVRGVRARSARILIISLKYNECHCITPLYHCTLDNYEYRLCHSRISLNVTKNLTRASRSNTGTVST